MRFVTLMLLSREMRVLTSVLVVVGSALASIGFLRLGCAFLVGALASSIATALRRPRRVTSWIAPMVLVANLVTVILAELIGAGTHHDGT